ncbi:hypothetical protein J0S82_016769 [Galemys pyrenaicus]|uniref:Uncharacterized protein n=1 Tax=Galemys pyrenaicus TaxID=202257 RepID=A0A8J6AJ59_GALPY|nr:hypothetical protein J0S82_016769 [Galemys pyrenaicus]
MGGRSGVSRQGQGRPQGRGDRCSRAFSVQRSAWARSARAAPGPCDNFAEFSRRVQTGKTMSAKEGSEFEDKALSDRAPRSDREMKICCAQS